MKPAVCPEAFTGVAVFAGVELEGELVLPENVKESVIKATIPNRKKSLVFIILLLCVVNVIF